MKPASINRRLASLRSFLEWANEVGFSHNIQLSKIPKFGKTEKTGICWLDRKEEKALLRAVERNGGKRDIAITYLIPKERWQSFKQELVELLRVSLNGKEVLQNSQIELELS